jgi:hypothetical protein
MPLHRDLRSRSRTAFVLLVLLAFVTIQSAAAVVEHPHNHGKDHSHCCTACHAGHLGVLQASGELRLSPPSVAESRLWLHEYRAAIESPGVPSPSRAPPLES